MTIGTGIHQRAKHALLISQLNQDNICAQSDPGADRNGVDIDDLWRNRRSDGRARIGAGRRGSHDRLPGRSPAWAEPGQPSGFSADTAFDARKPAAAGHHFGRRQQFGRDLDVGCLEYLRSGDPDSQFAGFERQLHLWRRPEQHAARDDDVAQRSGVAVLRFRRRSPAAPSRAACKVAEQHRQYKWGLLASNIGSGILQTLSDIANFNNSASGNFGSTLTGAQSTFLSNEIPVAQSASETVNNISAQNGDTYQQLQSALSQQQAMNTLYTGFVSNIQNVNMATGGDQQSQLRTRRPCRRLTR
jgi:hypothetical protein